MSVTIYNFELGWFRYLAEKYPGKVWIRSEYGIPMIVVDDGTSDTEETGEKNETGFAE